MTPSITDLEGYIGKPIDQICTTGLTSETQNHCAHFVSHALGVRLGTLCGDMRYATRGTGGSIRCDEIYNRLARRGTWETRPTHPANGLLIFVTSARNVVNGTMTNSPQKHVGIFHSGRVFNFSNGQKKVVADFTVEDFHAKFRKAYTGGDVSLYYGVPE